MGRDVPRPGRGRSCRSPRAGGASAQQIAWWATGRRAIALDPNWRGGDYYDAEPGDGPHAGLALARMLSQITFRSDDVFTDRFGREVVEPLDGRFTMWQRFEVERYLDYHGDKLVRRFDANSYLLLTKAMDLHDIGRGRGGIDAALARIAAPVLVDRHQLRHPVPAVPAAASCVTASLGQAATPSYVELDSPHGHDALPHRARPAVRPVAASSSPGSRRAPLMTDADDRPTHRARRRHHRAAAAARPHPGRSVPGAAATARPGAGAVGHVDVRHADGRRRPADGDVGRRRPVLQPLRQPHRQRLRGRHRRARRARRRRGRSRRAWERSARSCSACARPAITSSPSGSCMPGHSCCSRRPAPASASTSRSSTAPSPARSRPRCDPGKTVLVWGETPANPKLDVVDLAELGAIAGPMTVVDSTFATPIVQQPLALRRRPRRALGHQGASPGTTTPRSAWWPAAASCSTGCGGSPCSRAPTLRRTTR